MSNLIAKELIWQAVHRLELNTPRIAKCLELITEEQLWQRPNEMLSSIGNLILHLNGNITQYIISSIGGVEDKRNRDAEFSVDGGYTKSELHNLLDNTVQKAISVIQDCDEEELLKKRSVQGFYYTGIANIIHVVEHYSYHTGQIAYWTKILTGKDLGFYTGQNLNEKNVNG